MKTASFLSSVASQPQQMLVVSELADLNLPLPEDLLGTYVRTYARTCEGCMNIRTYSPSHSFLIVQYTVLYCTALFYTILYCTILHCTTTHRTVTHCTSLLHTVINHITLRCPLQHAALHHTATHITARKSFISLHNITPSSQSISRSQGSLSIFSSMPFLPCSVHQKYREVRTLALLILSYVTIRNSTHVSMHEHAVQTLKHFHFVTRKHHSTSFINSHFSFSTVSCVKTFK